MNKLPTKQIYLLTVIIVGIIALSVYSTYALFTFESSTSDIVSLHTPKSLQISENIYEYNQIIIEPNTVTTTDIDIYNSFDYNVCYSIWYKVVGGLSIQNNIQIFEKSADNLTSSGVLTSNDSIRVTLVIINDNDTQIKINLGTIGAKKEEDSCSLNLSEDKKIIDSSYNSIEKLTTKLLDEEVNNSKEINSGYLTYKDQIELITYKETDKIYISDKFNYNDELFTLTDSEELTLQELVDKKYLETKDIYFCKENDSCSILYKITEITQTKNEDETINYNITKYDKLIGYSKGTNGLRKVNNNDYVFYGDNPNNFIYYNCKNNEDIKTCELFRIIGLFYNEEKEEYNIKIIKNNSVGKYQFDNENTSTNNWNESQLSKYLNEEYKFINNYDAYIDTYKQEIERINTLETDITNMKINNQYINSKVNLLNLSDYLYASSCQKNKINEYTDECFTNNWLNNIEVGREWTLTSKENIIDEDNELSEDTVIDDSLEIENNQEVEKVINYVYSIDKDIIESNVNDSLEVRPVVFLKSRMLFLEGNGSLETPYIVK